MIVTEYYKTRSDGIQLERTYSDIDMMIRNITTGALYAEVINPVNSGRVYEETNIKIQLNDPPENLNDSIEYLVNSKVISVYEPESEPDYLNENEQDSKYFN